MALLGCGQTDPIRFCVALLGCGQTDPFREKSRCARIKGPVPANRFRAGSVADSGPVLACLLGSLLADSVLFLLLLLLLLSFSGVCVRVRVCVCLDECCLFSLGEAKY